MSIEPLSRILEATGYLADGEPAPGVRLGADAQSGRRGRQFAPDALWRGPTATTVYFKHADAQPDDIILSAWHREIWNEGFAPLLWVVSPKSIALYNGFSRPLSDHDAPRHLLRTFAVIEQQLIELDNLAGRLAMETGQFWLRSEKVNRKTSVDEQLLSDLAALEGDLVGAGLERGAAQGLIGRSIFTQYLVDRAIVDPARLEKECGAERLSLALRDQQSATRLFGWLAAVFNGDMFPPVEASAPVAERYLSRVADFLEAVDPKTGQMTFFPYQFDVIPVELISSIYEQFAHSKVGAAPGAEVENSILETPAQAKRRGVHYTRLPVVSLILDEVMSSATGDETVLDLTCGSGVFLVEALRRLVDKKGGAAPARSLIRSTLYNQIHGVDISEAAVRVAAFSLYLAALELDPDPQPPEALTFQKLIGRSLLVGDAREIETVPEAAALRGADGTPRAFDVVVGNGVFFDGTGDTTTINSGTITATGTALNIDRRLENSGTIRSLAGAAVQNGLGGGQIRSVTSENSGLIEGATVGYAVNSLVLVNTGTISATSGVGVSLDGSLLENRAGGVISGTTAAIRSDRFSDNYVVNAGTISGLVDFTSPSSSAGGREWFIDRGGMVNGNVRMGGGDDIFVTDLTRGLVGVSGAIDGGQGEDQFRFRTAIDAAARVAASRTGFEAIGYEVAGGAKLSLTGTGPSPSALTLSGEGVVDIAIDGAQTDRAILDLNQISSDQILGGAYYVTPNKLEVVSRGTLSFTVSGLVSSEAAAVRAGVATFDNAGAIELTRSTGGTLRASAISGLTGFASDGGAAITNSGAITLTGPNLIGVLGGASLINTGRITGTGGTGSTAVVGVSGVGDVVNSGVIDVSGVAVLLGSDFGFGVPGVLANSGTITSAGTAVRSTSFGAAVDNRAGGTISGRVAVALRGGAVVNAGTIDGTVQLAIPPSGGVSYDPGAFVSAGGTVNGSVLFGAGDDLFLQTGDTTGVTGRIEGGDGFDVFGRSYAASVTVALGTPGGTGFEGHLVQARGTDTTVTITADMPVDGDLYVGGDGRIVNRATVDGFLTTYGPYGSYYPGSDLPAALGLDLLPIEVRNEGTLLRGFDGRARGFVNTGSIGSREEGGSGVSVQSIGDLAFDNSGVIAAEPFESAVELDVSQTATVTVVNSGTVSGGFELNAVFDRVGTSGSVSFRNSGAIGGADEETDALSVSVTRFEGGNVLLENSGTLSANGVASVAAVVSIANPFDYEPTAPLGAVTYAVTNSGSIEANGGGAVVPYGFSPDGVQRFALTTPATGLAVVADRPASGTVVNTASGRITATGERSVALGVVGTALDLANAGSIRGGAGTVLAQDDVLGLLNETPFLAGAIQTQGTFGDTVRNTGVITGSVDLGAGDDRIENRGTIDGAVLLRAGDDRYLQGAGATLAGVVDGGDGADVIEVDAAGGGAVAAERFTNFERLGQSGAGVVSYAGAFGAPTVELNGGGLRVEADRILETAGLVVVTGSGLAESVEVAGTIAGDVVLGAGDDSFSELGTGRAGGLVEGGAGSDLYRIALAGDRAGVSAVSGFERLAVEGSGVLSLSSAHAFDAVALSGGRVVGLSGSTVTARTIDVGRDATFGSAGMVNGDVSVAGTLSPGASPGTMIVNGNVALAGTSVSVFEIAPTASDKLVVTGALSIAPGATLRIEPAGWLQPGASLDLITAGGGITGSFTNVLKPDTLFGFLVQQGGRLSLLGQFRADASSGGQVGRTIGYANSVLMGGNASAALLAAAPGLVGADGASDGRAFALLAPEPYASARQAAVEQGLTLADASRSPSFASRSAEPGLFTFGQFAADQRTLSADKVAGTARAKFGGYGLFGGLGYAGEGWSLGGFTGYLDGRQRLDARGAATDLEGAVFGLHGRATRGAVALTATAAYAATEADTRRALPGGSARGIYDLTGLTLDVAATYDVAIGSDWAVRPRIGGTVVRVRRDAVAETGSAAFAAQVARDRDAAAFLDGALTFVGGTRPEAGVRPFATLGVRYQATGRDDRTLAGLGGGGLGLTVEGANRARTLGTAALGVDADLAKGVTLFSSVAAERGEDDRREGARIGLRVAF